MELHRCLNTFFLVAKMLIL